MADAFDSAWLFVKEGWADVDTGRRALPESIRGMPGGDALVGPKLEEVLRVREGAYDDPSANVYEEELFGEDGEGDADLYEEMFQAYLDSQREKEMAEGIDDPRDKGDPEMPIAKPPTFRDELDARSIKNREKKEAMAEKLAREAYFAEHGRMPPPREIY